MTMPEAKQGMKHVIYTLLNYIQEKWSDLLLNWVQDNITIEGGDLQMDGPDDWWLENEEFGYR